MKIIWGNKIRESIWLFCEEATMKRTKAIFSISFIAILSLVVGLGASTAQSIQSPSKLKAALGQPTWMQVNVNGFGDPYNQGIYGFEIFNGHLYATSGNWKIGAQVWRLETNGTWVSVSEPGFGSSYANKNRAIPDMTVFNSYLYAGTAWGGFAGQVWRSPNGTTWDLVVNNGFGNPNNVGVAPFGTYKGYIYAGTIFDPNVTNGLEIWRSATGSPGEWQSVVTGGKGNAYNCTATSFTEFGDYFYAAIENMHDGAEIWRTDDGLTWTTVRSGGFGDADNTQTGGMTIYEGYLYVGTRNDVTGAQLFRTANGVTWEPVMDNGFEDLNNFKIEMLYVWNGSVFAGTDNNISGVEIWQSMDGLVWHQVNLDGFGDRNNLSVLWNTSTIEYNHNLYIGVLNNVAGGEIWRSVNNPIFIPLVKR
jgi:hypothetical protein